MHNSLEPGVNQGESRHPPWLLGVLTKQPLIHPALLSAAIEVFSRCAHASSSACFSRRSSRHSSGLSAAGIFSKSSPEFSAAGTLSLRTHQNFQPPCSDNLIRPSCDDLNQPCCDNLIWPPPCSDNLIWPCADNPLWPCSDSLARPCCTASLMI